MAGEVAKTQPSPMEAFRSTVVSLQSEFKMALPASIPVERFVRTVITTVQMNPDLLECDRKSVLATCMKAAQDGLLLDGREAAPVIFRGKDGAKCQYLPMVYGILKKMRNSGEIASVSVNAVHEKDYFLYELGDDEKIIHRPLLTGGDRGAMTHVYCIVRTKDGGIYREVMDKAQVDKVKNVSKAKNDGPWINWYEEQAKKTVIKRLAKRTPASSDMDQVIEHDNETIGFVRGELSSATPSGEAEMYAPPKQIGEEKTAGDLATEPTKPAATEHPAAAAAESPAKPAAETVPEGTPGDVSDKQLGKIAICYKELGVETNDARHKDALSVLNLSALPKVRGEDGVLRESFKGLMKEQASNLIENLVKRCAAAGQKK